MGSDSKTQSPFENLHLEDPVNVYAQIKAYDNDDSLEKVNLGFSGRPKLSYSLFFSLII